MLRFLDLGVNHRNEDSQYLVWLLDNTSLLGLLGALDFEVACHSKMFRPAWEVFRRLTCGAVGVEPRAFRLVSAVSFPLARGFMWRLGVWRLGGRERAF
jgi:hypothetical protein